MRVYIAAPYPARAYVAHLASYLSDIRHECTSTWARGTREITLETVGPSVATPHEDLVKHVEGDLYDVQRADMLLSVTAAYWLEHVANDQQAQDSQMWLHTGGRHVELGYALALNKPVIVVGPPENVFQRGLCMVVDDMSAAFQYIHEYDQRQAEGARA